MGIPYILAILFVVFAVLILIAIISFDARKSIIYLKAKTVTGLIVEKAGEQHVPVYGTQRRRRYVTYHVRCRIHGQDLILEAASSKRDLEPGNILVVHYIESRDGRICEVFPYEWDRLRELLVAAVIAVIIIAAAVAYKLFFE